MIEEKVINFDVLKEKIKKKRIKDKLVDGFNKTVNFIDEHKEGIGLVIGTTYMATEFVKKVIKSVEKEREEKLKDTRIYDRSLGKYVETIRPLRQDDYKKILERREEGEKVSSILLDMGLLK